LTYGVRWLTENLCVLTVFSAKLLVDSWHSTGAFHADEISACCAYALHVIFLPIYMNKRLNIL